MAGPVSWFRNMRLSGQARGEDLGAHTGKKMGRDDHKPPRPVLFVMCSLNAGQLPLQVPRLQLLEQQSLLI